LNLFGHIAIETLAARSGRRNVGGRTGRAARPALGRTSGPTQSESQHRKVSFQSKLSGG